MFKEKRILELFQQNISQRGIEQRLACSRHTISKILKLAVEKELTPQKLESMDEQDVHYFLFPERLTGIIYEKPDYAYIHNETKKVGVTLKLLWEEYVQACNAAKKPYYKYSRFCQMYQEYVECHGFTQHLTHRPGLDIQVDWDGKTMSYINPKTGKNKRAYLFVGSLPFSDYTFVEATDTMKEEDWIRCHIDMFEYIGGVTTLLVCDNCKTAIIHNRKYEDALLNVAYREFSDHYGTAILPARVRKPKDKALVERQVHEVTNNIIGRLRNEKFVSLLDLNAAIKRCLYEYNRKPFQKKKGSRYSVFMEEEKQFLKPLPRTRYEYAIWKKAKVQQTSHITVDNSNYSVHYAYIGKEVDVKMTKSNIQIFYQQKLLASHTRLYTYNAYSTMEEHMPPQQANFGKWNKKRFLNWAQSIGHSTYKVIFNVFECYKVEQQGYKSCFSILKLKDTYGKDRLEKACAIALTRTENPRYRQLNMILTSCIDLDEKNVQSAKQESMLDLENFSFVRGGKYYDEQ